MSQAVGVFNVTDEKSSRREKRYIEPQLTARPSLFWLLHETSVTTWRESEAPASSSVDRRSATALERPRVKARVQDSRALDRDTRETAGDADPAAARHDRCVPRGDECDRVPGVAFSASSELVPSRPSDVGAALGAQFTNGQREGKKPAGGSW